MQGTLSSKSSELKKLLMKGRYYKLRKKQILQSSDDRQVITLVLSGYIRRYQIANDGTVGVQIIYGPGDVFPLILVYKTLFNQALYSGPETFFYETMSDAEVRSIDAQVLRTATYENHQLFSDLLQEAGRHLGYCVQSLENVSLKQAYNRVAHLLLYFSKKFGSNVREGRQINVPLSHQDIGEALTLTRETVSTSIKKLRDKQLVKTNGKIVVIDIKKLEKEAYS